MAFDRDSAVEAGRKGGAVRKRKAAIKRMREFVPDGMTITAAVMGASYNIAGTVRSRVSDDDLVAELKSMKEKQS